MGDVAQGVRLWFGHDLLETLARLAGGRHLGLDPFRIAGLALPEFPDRLVQGHS